MKTTILPLPQHIYAAAAKAGTGRFDADWKYHQWEWRNDCGTACCLWGGGCIEAGLPVPSNGPPGAWSGQSVEHALLAGAMRQRNADEALAAVERIRVGEITDEDRGLVVRQAAYRGHAETLRRLLASGKISDEDRGLAVWWAANRGDAETVRRLLESGEISDEDRDRAVRVAKERGHAETVRMLAA